MFTNLRYFSQVDASSFDLVLLILGDYSSALNTVFKIQTLVLDACGLLSFFPNICI